MKWVRYCQVQTPQVTTERDTKTKPRSQGQGRARSAWGATARRVYRRPEVWVRTFGGGFDRDQLWIVLDEPALVATARRELEAAAQRFLGRKLLIILR